MIYFAIYFILFIGSFTGLKPKTFGLYLFFLIIILGLRSSEIGADTARYIEYYNYVDQSTGHMEIGWNLLSRLCKYFGLSAYIFNLIVASLTLSIIGYVIRLQKSHKIIGFSLFLLYSLGFYFLMFNGMRQLFAGAIVFLAFYLLAENKNWKIIVLIILLASCFHASALITIPVVFLPKMSLKINWVLLVLVLSFAVGMVASDSFFTFFAGNYAHDVYTYGLRDSFAYALTVGAFTNVLFLLIFNFSSTNLKQNIWMKLFFISVVVMNLLINLVIGPRIVYYFSIAQIIAISLFVAESKPNTNINVAICYIYALLTFTRFMIGEYNSKEGSLIPYQMVSFDLI